MGLFLLPLLLGVLPVDGPARWSEPSAEVLREARAEGSGWKTSALELGGATLHVLLRPAAREVGGDERVIAWVRTCARSVALYFGRFPVREVFLRVDLQPGRGVRGGMTFWGRRIRVSVGEATSAEDFAADWVLTHELFHLGFPDLPEANRYLEEGLSTYLEPIARTRAGVLPAAETWGSFVDGFPKGLPRPGDEGLDRTASWGNTYWGGARFWLLADLEIRRRTKNARSLDDAIKGILTAGGDGSVHWELDRLLRVGDAATGTSVLTDLHGELGSKPVQTELEALWRRLGVKPGRSVTFDDTAPEAWLRKAIAR
jgi:hypothetical protein